jgi:hypothetical protein
VKKEWAIKWVSALRSGKYKQGKNELRNKDRFCCLGVLCDLSKTGTWVSEKQGSTGYLGRQGALPDEVIKVTGMNSCAGRIDTCSAALIDLNDGTLEKQYSFNEIADTIEMFWEEL